MNDFIGNELIGKDHLIFTDHIFNSIKPDTLFDEFYNIFSVEGVILNSLSLCRDNERDNVYKKIKELIENNIGQDYQFLKSEIIVYKSELRKTKN